MDPLDFQFLKDRYDFELTRKEQLNAALNLPVGVLGGVGGVLALMGRTFVYRDDLLWWVFMFPFVGAIVAFVVCLYQLSHVYHRQTYIYLPLLKDIAAKREEFLGFATAVAGGEAEVLLEFEKQFHSRIIDAADRNTENNDRRSSLLFWARVWLFIVLALGALAGIPFIAEQVRFHASTGSSDTGATVATRSAKHDAPTSAISP